MSNHTWQSMCLQDYINIKSWEGDVALFEFSFVPEGKRWGATAMAVGAPSEEAYEAIFRRVSELRRVLRNNGGLGR